MYNIKKIFTLTLTAVLLYNNTAMAQSNSSSQKHTKFQNDLRVIETRSQNLKINTANTAASVFLAGAALRGTAYLLPKSFSFLVKESFWETPANLKKVINSSRSAGVKLSLENLLEQKLTGRDLMIAVQRTELELNKKHLLGSYKIFNEELEKLAAGKITPQAYLNKKWSLYGQYNILTNYSYHNGKGIKMFDGANGKYLIKLDADFAAAQFPNLERKAIEQVIKEGENLAFHMTNPYACKTKIFKGFLKSNTVISGSAWKILKRSGIILGAMFVFSSALNAAEKDTQIIEKFIQNPELLATASAQQAAAINANKEAREIADIMYGYAAEFAAMSDKEFKQNMTALAAQQGTQEFKIEKSKAVREQEKKTYRKTVSKYGKVGR
ncbi:hypothetical protein AAIR98_001683 [Elusimicrobium simillimum]|uniref:hypothetical protein n=1 Tax=Elusimicrobium simillimum TaxID=3143438 RepID=UPI003C6F59AC